MIELLTVVVSAAVGALVAYLGSIWQTRFEARRVIHERVHEQRAKLYPVAWKLTGSFPRRPRTDTATYGSLRALAVSLRDWYYEEGGLYLSGGARRAYTDWQDAVDEVLKTNQGDESELSEEHYEIVRQAGSSLRTMLTRDLLSRSRPPMGKRFPEPT